MWAASVGSLGVASIYLVDGFRGMMAEKWIPKASEKRHSAQCNSSYPECCGRDLGSRMELLCPCLTWWWKWPSSLCSCGRWGLLILLTTEVLTGVNSGGLSLDTSLGLLMCSSLCFAFKYQRTACTLCCDTRSHSCAYLIVCLNWMEHYWKLAARRKEEDLNVDLLVESLPHLHHLIWWWMYLWFGLRISSCSAVPLTTQGFPDSSPRKDLFCLEGSHPAQSVASLSVSVFSQNTMASKSWATFFRLRDTDKTFVIVLNVFECILLWMNI